MKDLSILIVEDELLIAETISETLLDLGYKEIRVVSTVDEAILELANSKPDLILTDINLGSGRTGIDLGHLLFSKYRIPFIYISSYSSVDIIESAKYTHPGAFIVKPFKDKDIRVAVELALFNSIKKEESPGSEIIIKVGRSTVRLNCKDILWIESERNYSTIHLTDNGRKVARISLSEINDQLPGDVFFRIHKSYIINKTRISEVKSNFIIIDSKELPVGRTYLPVVSKLLV